MNDPVYILFPADHPAAAGHFPGNPLVPGALMLAMIATRIGIAAPYVLRAAKFTHPARPGDTPENCMPQGRGG